MVPKDTTANVRADLAGKARLTVVEAVVDVDRANVVVGEVVIRLKLTRLSATRWWLSIPTKMACLDKLKFPSRCTTRSRWLMTAAANQRTNTARRPSKQGTHRTPRYRSLFRLRVFEMSRNRLIVANSQTPVPISNTDR